MPKYRVPFYEGARMSVRLRLIKRLIIAQPRCIVSPESALYGPKVSGVK
jgi:hypothetical protein